MAEGGSWGKGVGVVAGCARHQVACEEDVRGWMRKMMVIERNATISRHPQDQGTVVGDYENDKCVGVVARRARHQVAGGGGEDEKVGDCHGEKGDGDVCKSPGPGIHSIKEPLLMVVRMTKVLA